MEMISITLHLLLNWQKTFFMKDWIMVFYIQIHLKSIKLEYECLICTNDSSGSMISSHFKFILYFCHLKFSSKSLIYCKLLNITKQYLSSSQPVYFISYRFELIGDCVNLYICYLAMNM